MKTEYLISLRSLLDGYQMEETEKDDIINDYNDMYENYLDYGITDDEVEGKLGKPRSIIGSLVEGYNKVPRKQPKGNKVIALMPFISLIIFFVSGFVFDLWAYSWMAFLLIPITAIIINMAQDKDEHMTTALSPFVAVIAFFILGFGFDLWHPGWVVFLIIPVLGIFNSRRGMKPLELLTALSPFIALIVYVFLVVEYEGWHPGWLVFMIIPAIGLLNEKNIGKLFLSELLLLGGVAGYLYIGYTFEEWGYAAFVFVPFILYMIYIGNITIWDKDIPNGYKITVIATLATYFTVSFISGWWAITWLIFFAIPVYAISRETKGNEKIIALTPFVAVTIFMLLGFVFSAWAWAWIAFLIIPMSAIIKSD